MLFIRLFVKTDTRHLVCRPTHLPAAVGLSDAFNSGPFPLSGSPVPITHPNLGALGSGGSQWEFITSHACSFSGYVEKKVSQAYN